MTTHENGPVLDGWQMPDITRLYHGNCPKCGEWKFIGHGPLCLDCFLVAVSSTWHCGECHTERTCHVCGEDAVLKPQIPPNVELSEN